MILNTLAIKAEAININPHHKSHGRSHSQPINASASAAYLGAQNESEHHAVIHEHSENGHVTTFDILTRAATTLSHPTTWAQSMYNLVASASAIGETHHSELHHESANSGSAPADQTHSNITASATRPLVTCITPPVLTLTEHNAFTDVTMTRRLSLTELSQPPYAPWPPRATRTALCATAAACASRAVANGEEDPNRFMLPWIMDKRFMFPLPLDHQGRASFRSGRWWSRRNLGYEHIRPVPVKFVMRTKSRLPAAAPEIQERSSSLAEGAAPNVGGSCDDVGDETLPLSHGRRPQRHSTLPTSISRSSIMTIREAALAMARAGHERVVSARRNSLPPERSSPPPPGLAIQSTAHSDAHGHVTDSDTDTDMDDFEVVAAQSRGIPIELNPQGTEEMIRPTPQRSYSPPRPPPRSRGRSPSLRKVAVSAVTEASLDEIQVVSKEPAADEAASPARRIFAQRWSMGNGRSISRVAKRERSMDSVSQDSYEESDDSLGLSDGEENASETSEESVDADSVDGYDLKQDSKRCLLLGTVLEDELDAMDCDPPIKSQVRSQGSTRYVSFFLADSPEEEAELQLINASSALKLVQRTEALVKSDLPHHHHHNLHNPQVMAHLRPKQEENEHSSTPSFAAAVLARPVPKVFMPGLHGSGGADRLAGASAKHPKLQPGGNGPPMIRPVRPPRAQQTVYLDSNSIMDWQPQLV
ncbi:hypothetical protein OC845_004450 [Tilletia horrida]|nr:hypothetical protein OC845_004450 [Tilletia horrida]